MSTKPATGVCHPIKQRLTTHTKQRKREGAMLKASRRPIAHKRKSAITALLAGGLTLLGPLGPGITRAQPTAHAARTFSLNERGNLRLTSKEGFTLNERGTASGSVKGTIYVHLTIVSTSRVKAEVSIYPPGGSITGYASASYAKGSSMATFSGSMSITRGSGGYSHAHVSGLSFSGTIARSNDAVTVHVSGRVSD
jgi:hypothetical protein